MKKVLTIILALVLCLSLCACGSSDQGIETTNVTEGTIGKDKMIAVAESVTVKEIGEVISENMLKAEQQYCNKTLEVTGYVREVKEDHVVLITYTNMTNLYVNAYMPTEDLLSLSYNNVVKVVGKTTDTINEETYMASGFEFTREILEMPEAYLIEIVE